MGISMDYAPSHAVSLLSQFFLILVNINRIKAIAKLSNSVNSVIIQKYVWKIFLGKFQQNVFET